MDLSNPNLHEEDITLPVSFENELAKEQEAGDAETITTIN